MIIEGNAGTEQLGSTAELIKFKMQVAAGSPRFGNAALQTRLDVLTDILANLIDAMQVSDERKLELVDLRGYIVKEDFDVLDDDDEVNHAS